MPEAAPFTQPEPPTLRRLFFGDDGLRAGWSFALFALLAALFAFAANIILHRFHLLPPPARRLPGAPAPESPFRPALISEIAGLLVFLLPAAIMARIERRPFARYGFTSAGAVRDLLAGIAWGLLAMTLLIGVLVRTHHLVFDLQLLHGSSVLVAALQWLLFFFIVGLAEEFQTRGYIQYTVSRGVAGIARAMNASFRYAHAVGFWVAAFLFSILLFMAGHLANPGETLPGILAVGLAGTVFAFSLYRTGSLWWAIGFHTAWDWAQSFLYGVPDSGMMVQNHLLATHPLGNPLLSGASTGPEGSVLVIPTLLLVALVIHLTLPRRDYPLTPDQTSPPMEQSF